MKIKFISTRQERKRMEPASFKLYSQYYDLLYQDKDYDSETSYIVKLIREFSPECKAILELGSGTFQHARRLVQAGYTVHGIEISPGMMEMAGEFSLDGLTAELADISSFSVARKFDVALSLFHVISYLTENEQLISAFSRVHESLNEGGFFIFDIWYSPAVYKQIPESRIKKMENEWLKVTRKAEPVIHYDQNLVDVHYDIQIEDRQTSEQSALSEIHSMRHFSSPEIGLIARFCGFNLLRSEEFGSGKAPGSETWGVCYILQKI